MSSAEPRAPVCDCRQVAARNPFVRGSDAPSLEPETFSKPRQAQEVRAVTVVRKLIPQVPRIELEAVIRRHGHKGGETAVVVEPLAYERAT